VFHFDLLHFVAFSQPVIHGWKQFRVRPVGALANFSKHGSAMSRYVYTPLALQVARQVNESSQCISCHVFRKSVSSAHLPLAMLSSWCHLMGSRLGLAEQILDMRVVSTQRGRNRFVVRGRVATDVGDLQSINKQYGRRRRLMILLRTVPFQIPSFIRSVFGLMSNLLAKSRAKPRNGVVSILLVLLDRNIDSRRIIRNLRDCKALSMECFISYERGVSNCVRSSWQPCSPLSPPHIQPSP